MKVLPVLPNPKLSIFLLQDHLEIYTLKKTEPCSNKQPRRKQRGIFRTLSLYTYAASGGEYTQKRLNLKVTEKREQLLR